MVTSYSMKKFSKQQKSTKKKKILGGADQVAHSLQTLMERGSTAGAWAFEPAVRKMTGQNLFQQG